MPLVATEICLFATRMCCEGTAGDRHQGWICPPAPTRLWDKAVPSKHSTKEGAGSVLQGTQPT